MTRTLALLFLGTAFATGPAPASSTQWFETEGGSLRLITAGMPDQEGRLRGMIDIVLKPGWKTYWRDPGDAGVPPVLDVSRSAGLSGATLQFPAPARHDEGDFVWNGYDRPVALPVVFEAKEPGVAGAIDAELFLGVCETICIPVKVDFAIDPSDDPDNVEDTAAVAAAFDALPAPARPDFGIAVVSSGNGSLVVKATAPGDPNALEFFIAADENYSFGRPEKSVRDGVAFFTLEVAGPAVPPPSGVLHYTLTGETGAVSGLVPYF